MFRDFPYAIAWTDAMPSGNGYVGLIEYQPSREDAQVQVLWVYAPGCTCAREAEAAADHMFRAIGEITPEGRVIYRDGVSL